jgi:hypothetical protein
MLSAKVDALNTPVQVRPTPWQAAAAAAILSIVLATSLYAFYPGAMDFRMFYSAAEMVRAGKGHQLYDVAAQRAFQAKYTPYPGLVFNHPPVTALLYVPLTFTSLRTGYLLWSVGNMLALACFAMLLRAPGGLLSRPAHLYALALLFGPALFTLIQGQTSILVLLANAAALALLRKRKPFPAGIVLSLALIKPQLALPMFAIAALQRKWRIVAGWLIGAIAFLTASIAISGWKVLTEYPQFLRAMERLPSTGIKPAYMASLRALYVYALASEPPVWIMALVTVLLLLISSRFPIENDRGYASAMVVTLLLAYHLFPHDLVLLLIPLAVLVENVEPRKWSTTVIAAIWLAPLLIDFLRPRALPVLAVEMLAVLTWILWPRPHAGGARIAG